MNGYDGTYVWLVTATNAAGDDQGQITVELLTPEPGAALLAITAVAGLVAVFRRRTLIVPGQFFVATRYRRSCFAPVEQ